MPPEVIRDKLEKDQFKKFKDSINEASRYWAIDSTPPILDGSVPRPNTKLNFLLVSHGQLRMVADFFKKQPTLASVLRVLYETNNQCLLPPEPDLTGPLQPMSPEEWEIWDESIRRVKQELALLGSSVDRTVLGVETRHFYPIDDPIWTDGRGTINPYLARSLSRVRARFPKTDLFTLKLTIVLASNLLNFGHGFYPDKTVALFREFGMDLHDYSINHNRTVDMNLRAKDFEPFRQFLVMRLPSLYPAEDWVVLSQSCESLKARIDRL